jgi:hypothetical protein
MSRTAHGEAIGPIVGAAARDLERVAARAVGTPELNEFFRAARLTIENLKSARRAEK